MFEDGKALMDTVMARNIVVGRTESALTNHISAASTGAHAPIAVRVFL